VNVQFARIKKGGGEDVFCNYEYNSREINFGLRNGARICFVYANNVNVLLQFSISASRFDKACFRTEQFRVPGEEPQGYKRMPLPPSTRYTEPCLVYRRMLRYYRGKTILSADSVTGNNEEIHRLPCLVAIGCGSVAQWLGRDVSVG
jgi:hypothetical protein